VLDENGKIRQTNTAAEELFQMNTQDLIGHHLNELFSSLAGTPGSGPAGVNSSWKATIAHH